MDIKREIDDNNNNHPITCPFITVIIVVRNEKKHIKKCFQSLLAQDYPHDRYEIIIVDGESDDGTIDIINNYWEEYLSTHKGLANTTLKVLHNPKHILAAGWNIGIKFSNGEYVVRIDAHAFVDSDFLRKNIEVMLRIGNVECVGGPLNTLSETGKGEIIKEALSSPFGVGGAKFRYVKTAGYVDTIAYGLYRRNVFETVGYFNENLVRTQDNDLHRRMRDLGLKFYLDPEIHSYYYARNTTKELCRQQFLNGKWTMINFRSRPGNMSIRHFVPFLFDISIIVALILVLLDWRFSVIAPGLLAMHFICGTYFGVKRSNSADHRIKLPFIFLIIHLCYGFGSICGIFHKTV